MADLQIVDAPEIPTNNITGQEKLPTGGSGNYSITLDSVADYAKTKKDLVDTVTVDGKVNGVRQELNTHVEDSTNPHQVTKDQVGLGNVDNTADIDKPVSNATSISLDTKADKAQVIIDLNLKADKSYVDTAKSEAIASASLDATTKANASEVNAKSYTDIKVRSVTNNFFKTKALMTGSALPNDSYAMVTDDSFADNNGLYVKTEGTWFKSNYDASYLLNGTYKPKIRVFLQYATVFYVESLAENGEYLRHEFTYVDDRDKDQKGWTYPRIRRNNDIIMQGNFSLVHQMIDEENWGNPLNSNDSIYIGLGHGCEETIYTRFYLDGVEFDPSTQRGYLYGNEFRLLTVSKILRPDKAKSVQQFEGVAYSTALVPHDIRSKRQAELVIRGGNEIIRDQKMHILKNRVKFTYYHAAMQTTLQEYINGSVWLNDIDGTFNHFPNGLDDPQPLAPSTVRLTDGVSYGNKNCFANKFKAVGGYDGVTIEAYTEAWNVDSEENKSHHIYTWFQRSGSNKVYFNPLNTLYLELAYPEYESKVFNSGDTIHTASYTKLTMT